ncbi:MAG TPA: sialidase family protein [Thermoanaerobaculia bacterium]|nr:sialidase family protein [Thermoanaerobaculia bacterium]
MKLTALLALLLFVPAADAATIREIPSPAGANAAEPFLHATRDGGALLSWLEPNAKKTALKFARYTNGNWTKPRTIVERDDLFVNWADFPSVIEDAKGALFAHWLQKSGKGTYAYDVMLATSIDGGATWSAPFVLNRDGKEAEHGFATMVALPGSGIGITWLDGRAMTGGDHDEHEGGGDMMLRYATVDADGNVANEVMLDDRTCECCTTGMAMMDNGPLVVYRDRSADEIRDIAWVRTQGKKWDAPQPLRKDGWKINGCPVNGPQIDALGNRVATAWFTAANDQPRVYVTFLHGQAYVVDDGKPLGRVDVVLLDEHTALVSWLEQTADNAEIRARIITRAGKRGPSLRIADSGAARGTGFTRMARVGKDVWFTWTETKDGGKRVRVARYADR